MLNYFLTDAQLNAEIEKCEYCEEKPCKQACPVDCSPTDFIMAAKLGEPSDFKRAASLILGNNPLGGVCGAVCPDYHCMQACVHKHFDCAVNIPAVQATIIQKAKELKLLPDFKLASPKNKSIAIVGGGPAGLGAAAVLMQQGYAVTLFEKEAQLGNVCRKIPDHRLAKEILDTDIAFLQGLGDLQIKTNAIIAEPKTLLEQDFAAVIIATGLPEAVIPNIPGKENILSWNDFLAQQQSLNLNNKNVAIIGGGAIAVDCAVTAKLNGANQVDLIYRRNMAAMPLTAKERQELLTYNIGFIGKAIVTAVKASTNKLEAIHTQRVNLPAGQGFDKKYLIPASEAILTDYQYLVAAAGSRNPVALINNKKIFYAGDMINGATTVVEAVASGKNAAIKVIAMLEKQAAPKITKDSKNTTILAGRITTPVSLATDFFGRKIHSPFILSASPVTDGYEQMKKAYDAGWPGGILKTAFDNIPIHIPSEYMFAYDELTYANCDNVSGHPLDRVCAEIKKLIQEYPDRLTIGSTGGPVTGNDEHDKAGWQSNTKKLEQAGAMAIEYSLSCPQGGDGTEGDIVSQNAALTAKIIDWVMEISDPEVPKLFKLTSAVTSVYPILTAIKEVFAKHPNKKAGITLANSFPTMTFRKGKKEAWEEGIIAGMSGDAVKYISNLALANAANMNIHISGNGGPMDYKAAADFLALGVKTVQFCTVAMKYGVHIIDELHSGLSYLMQARKLKSVKELIGCALPKPITDFMDLTEVKKISAIDADLCEHCGNCTRCPYQAITLNEDKVPVTDAAKCIGCSICVQKCFAKALYMRDRTKAEQEVLSEK